jgi:hypothetical protein
MEEEKNISLNQSLEDLNQKLDNNISQKNLEKTYTEDEFDIDSNFKDELEEEEKLEKVNLTQTFNNLEQQNLDNFNNVKNGSIINIIKEESEDSSSIEKNNELLSQMHDSMNNLNQKLDLIYQNEGITEEQLEKQLDVQFEQNNDDLEQSGGDVNASIQDDFNKFKEDNYYEERINFINDNAPKEEIGNNGSYEVDDFDNFDDFEIMDYVGESSDILIKQDKDKLQVEDDVLFEILVNKLSFKPELMFNNEIPEEKRTFGYVKIQDNNGKVSLPKFLYRTFERKEGGDHRTIHDYVNELIIMKNYLKNPQNYLEKLVDNILSFETNNRNLNLYYVKPIILNRKIVFKNNASSDDDIYNNLTWFRDQKKYIDELSKYNPKKLGGLGKKRYTDAMRGKYTLLRNKFQIFDNSFIKDENVSNIEKLYMKDGLLDNYNINSKVSSDKSLIGHSILNNNNFNTNSASVFYINNIEKYEKNVLKDFFILKERKLAPPIYEYYFNEEDNEIIKKVKIPGETFNIAGYFIYSFDYNKRKNINSYKKFYIEHLNFETNFIICNDNEYNNIDNLINEIYLNDDNIIICYNISSDNNINKDIILFLKKLFTKIFSLENILSKYNDLLKYSIESTQEVKDFLSCYNIDFHEIDKIHINFFRNLFTNKALDTLEEVLEERNKYLDKLNESKNENNNINFDIKIKDKYPIKYDFENTTFDTDFRRFLFLKQNIDNGLLNIDLKNTKETVQQLNEILELSTKEYDNLNNTYNQLFKNDNCDVSGIDNKNNEMIKFKKETISSYYTSKHSIEFYKNIDKYSNKSEICNLNTNMNCHFIENCENIPNFHLKYKINYYKNLINLINDRIELCKSFNLDDVNNKLNTLINYKNNYSKNKINNIDNIFFLDYSATSLYFSEDYKNIDLYKIGAALKDYELEKEGISEVSIGADDDVEMDGAYKQTINGKTVVTESTKEIGIDNFSDEYQNKMNKFNFNLLKKITKDPNYSCELISNEFKYNEYGFICNKIKSYIIKLKLDMNIDDIRRLVLDIHKDFENLPSYEFYKKLKYNKTDLPENKIRTNYNITYGTFNNKLSVHKSAILIARLCIELETRIPPYRFNNLYIIKESDKKIGGKDTETVSFIENKLNFLVYVGAHKAKLGDSGIIMYDTQTTKLEQILQVASINYEKYLEDIQIKQLFLNKELYDSKQELLISKEQYVNHNNYKFDFVFNGENDINDTNVEKLIKKLENDSMYIDDKYIENIINNKKYGVLIKLKDVLRSRYRYLNYYEMYLILQIINNNEKYKLKGYGYSPDKYGQEANECIKNGTCCYSFYPENIEKYTGFTQIYNNLDNKYNSEIKNINKEFIRLETLDNLGIGRTVMYTPTHKYRNFVIYDEYTMKYKFSYNENDARLFHDKYCKTDDYIKGIGGFNGLTSLDYQEHLKQYCITNNLLVSDVQQIVNIINNLNIKKLKDTDKQDFYNYYKLLFTVSDNNQDILNKFMDNLRNNIEIDDNIFSKFKTNIQNKLGYFKKSLKTKDFKLILEENTNNNEDISNNTKQKDIDSYLGLKYSLENIKNTSIKDSLKRMVEHNYNIIKSNSDKQRLNNLKKVFIEFRVYMNLLKNKFNITINNYKLKKYSDDSTNGDYTFKHMNTFDIGLSKPLFIPTYSNKNILNLKNTELIYNKYENIDFMKDLVKYSQFFQDYEFLYTLDDIDKVFGETSIYVGKRKIKESRFSNRVAGDVILIYIIQELDNLFNKANEVQNENPKLNILTNICKFIYEFLEQQDANIRMLDYDENDLLLMKTTLNYQISKDENLVSVEMREFQRIAHEQGLDIEIEDGFNILDNQRNDDSHITDEAEKNEYNNSEYYRDEVGDDLYGGDDDDDFIDDENYGNIFDSDDYDNQYEYQ